MPVGQLLPKGSMNTPPSTPLRSSGAVPGSPLLPSVPDQAAIAPSATEASQAQACSMGLRTRTEAPPDTDSGSADDAVPAPARRTARKGPTRPLFPPRQ